MWLDRHRFLLEYFLSLVMWSALSLIFLIYYIDTTAAEHCCCSNWDKREWLMALCKQQASISYSWSYSSAMLPGCTNSSILYSEYVNLKKLLKYSKLKLFHSKNPHAWHLISIAFYFNCLSCIYLSILQSIHQSILFQSKLQTLVQYLFFNMCT